MKIGFDVKMLLVTLISAIVLGFAIGMIVAGHTDWECREQGTIC